MSARGAFSRSAQRLLPAWVPRGWTAWLEGMDPTPRFPILMAQLEQCYATDARARFEELRREAAALLPHLPSLKRRRYRFLLEVLEANILVRNNQLAPAAEKYEAAIRAVGGRRGAVLRSGVNNQDARNLDYVSVVLALQYNNLGEILSAEDVTAARAEPQFRRAIELQPGLGYPLQRMATHLIRRQQWDQAEAAFEDLLRCAPSPEARKALPGNLAYVRCERATRLKRDGKAAEAMKVLADALEKLIGQEQPGWEGRIHYLRAECLVEIGRAGDALDEYTASHARYVFARLFPSASSVAEIRSDLLVTRNDDAAALAGYKMALKDADSITTDSETGEDVDATRRRRAQLLAKMGLLELATRDGERGRRALAAAVAIAPGTERSNRYEAIVNQSSRLLERDDLVVMLKFYFTDLLAASSDPRTRRELVFAIRSLHGKVERRVLDPGEIGLPPADNKLLNVVTPVGIEMHAATLAACGGPDQVINALAPAMRARVEAKYGLPIPGVRLRSVEDMAPGVYSILLNELPCQIGVLRADRRAYTGSLDVPKRLGIDTTAGLQVQFVSEGCWVSPADADRLAAAGHATSAPLELMMEHTETIIAANLAEFAGHQEVRNLLESAGLIDSEWYAEMSSRESYAHIDALTEVARCLLAERAPILRFADVHRIFMSGMDRRLPTHEIVDEIRSADFVRPALWGNDTPRQLFQIGPGILEQIDRARRGTGGRALAMDPVVLQGIQGALRAHVPQHGAAGVVVPGAGRTALVRSIVEVDFPDVPVLSLHELMPGLGAGIAATIELPEAAPKQAAASAKRKARA